MDVDQVDGRGICPKPIPYDSVALVPEFPAGRSPPDREGIPDQNGTAALLFLEKNSARCPHYFRLNRNLLRIPRDKVIDRSSRDTYRATDADNLQMSTLINPSPNGCRLDS